MRLVSLILGLFISLAATGGQAGELKPLRGEAAPPLVLKDLAGKVHKLGDYRGKVVLVNFWATWCPPCREEMPSMQRLTRKMQGRPFALLAVDMGENEKEVKDYIRGLGATFTVLMDPDGKAVGDWRVGAAPTSYLVDGEGKVRYGVAGGFEWDSPKALEAINRIMPAQAEQTRR